MEEDQISLKERKGSTKVVVEVVGGGPYKTTNSPTGTIDRTTIVK